jgi:hypothetical protein
VVSGGDCFLRAWVCVCRACCRARMMGGPAVQVGAAVVPDGRSKRSHEAHSGCAAGVSDSAGGGRLDRPYAAYRRLASLCSPRFNAFMFGFVACCFYFWLIRASEVAARFYYFWLNFVGSFLTEVCFACFWEWKVAMVCPCLGLLGLLFASWNRKWILMLLEYSHSPRGQILFSAFAEPITAPAHLIRDSRDNRVYQLYSATCAKHPWHPTWQSAVDSLNDWLKVGSRNLVLQLIRKTHI